MARTIQQTVYQFDELTDTAKQKAIAEYRSWSSYNINWYDRIYSDLLIISELLGIDVDQTSIVMPHGVRYVVPHFKFNTDDSTFSFSGYYSYRRGWKGAVRKQFGEDVFSQDHPTPLAQLVQNWRLAQRKLQKAHRYQSSCEFKCEAGLWWVTTDPEDGHYHEITEEENALIDLLELFYDYAATHLKEHWKYINSDDYIIIEFTLGSYEFLSDGTIYYTST